MFDNHRLTEKQCTIWDENYFHEILAQEKKRSERSGNPLLLMLLNINNIYNGSRSSRDIYSDVASVSSAIRESDIKGWYEHESIVGVIFTEIGEVDINIAKAQIVQKITEGFRSVAGIDHIGDRAISFRIFPEGSCKVNVPKALINLRTLNECSAKESRSGTLPHVLCSLLRQRYLLFLGDILLILLALVLGNSQYFGYAANRFHFNFSSWLAILLYPTVLYIFDLYEVNRKFQSTQFFLRLALAGVMAGFVWVFVFSIIPGQRFRPGLVGLEMLLAFIFLTGWRFVYGCFSLAANGRTGTLIIGAGESGMSVYRLLKSCTTAYEVKGFIDDDPALQGKVMGSPAVVGTLDRLIETAEEMGIRSAILAVNRPHTPRFIRAILEARLAGMEIIELPNLYERTSGRVPVQFVEDQWLLSADGFNLLFQGYIQKIKRILDFAVSALLLFTSAPMMMVTALAIRLESPGPVFYRQDRVGLAGMVFRVFKFRSMTVNAETKGAQWAQKDDPRVTRVGGWIRIFRIDELPQILNIFLGDMSLVGPRPERPEFVKDLGDAIPYYSARHCVRPGITGWAQVNFPYGATVEDALRKLEYDLYYVKNMSILLDLKIIVKTVGVVLMGDGAR